MARGVEEGGYFSSDQRRLVFSPSDPNLHEAFHDKTKSASGVQGLGASLHSIPSRQFYSSDGKLAAQSISSSRPSEVDEAECVPTTADFLNSVSESLASTRVWSRVEQLLRTDHGEAENSGALSKKGGKSLQPWVPLLTFSRQVDALEFVSAIRRRLDKRRDAAWLGVWAEEIGTGGKRQFLGGCLRALVAPAASRLRSQKDAFCTSSQTGCTYSCCSTGPSGEKKEQASLVQESGRRGTCFSSASSSSCSLYELLESERPVWLFLDVEFDRTQNSSHCCSKVLRQLLLQLRAFLCYQCGICVRLDEIVLLDGTSETKFSHHILFKAVRSEVVRQPAFWLVRDESLSIENEMQFASSPDSSERKRAFSTLFPDAQSAGRFIEFFLQDLKVRMDARGEKRQSCSMKECAVTAADSVSHEDLLSLFPFNRSGERVPVVDCGVYTRNRCFRLLGSTKLGKNLPLKVSRFNSYPLGKVAELQILRSLVSFAPSCLQIPLFPPFLLGGETGASGLPRGAALLSVPRPTPFHSKPRGSALAVPSSLEALCSFVASDWIVRSLAGGAEAREVAGEWTGVFFPESRTAVVTPKGSRFCERIGREHKSNSVFLVVTLEEGVYYQKCHDPDCKGFRANPRPLPPALFLSLESIDDVAAALTSEDRNEESVKAEASITTVAEVDDGKMAAEEELDLLAAATAFSAFPET